MTAVTSSVTTASLVVDPLAPQPVNQPDLPLAAVPEVRLIHVLVDGMTAFGKVWYRGQEIEIGPEDFEDTKDRNGRSWLEDDAKAQMRRFQAIQWAEGPWPFDPAEDQTYVEAEKRRARSPRG